MPITVGIVIHPGFQILDTVGPTTAFEIASHFCDGYDVRILAAHAGHVESSSKLALAAAPLTGEEIDTIIVSGGEIVRDMAALHIIVPWLMQVCPRRLASVCSGAFLLAEAGRLNGKVATTHWDSTERFRRRYPAVNLMPDRIFTRDGNVWTSAGITAGIDLALALIEDDFGPAVARRTAQQLVVHRQRPGGQSQFAGLVDAGGFSGRFAELVDWMRANLDKPLTVDSLADQAAMSPRNFARAFARDTGSTPAKALERLRVEAAQIAIEAGDGSLEQIASRFGLGDAGRMRRSFQRILGHSPRYLRRRTSLS